MEFAILRTNLFYRNAIIQRIFDFEVRKIAILNVLGSSNYRYPRVLLIGYEYFL